MIGSWVGSLQDLFPGMAQNKWQRSNQQLQVWGGTGYRNRGPSDYKPEVQRMSYGRRPYR